jgi:hypothetical protein
MFRPQSSPETVFAARAARRSTMGVVVADRHAESEFVRVERTYACIRRRVAWRFLRRHWRFLLLLNIVIPSQIL